MRHNKKISINESLYYKVTYNLKEFFFLPKWHNFIEIKLKILFSEETQNTHGEDNKR